jgi:hypothetical protein
MGLDGDLELPSGAGDRGGRVAAGAPHAVDLDGDLEVLAGAEPFPRAVGSQGERDAVRCLVPDGGHLGARVVPRPGRADLLEEAVDAGRASEQVEPGRDGAAAASPRGTGDCLDGGHLFSLFSLCTGIYSCRRLTLHHLPSRY